MRHDTLGDGAKGVLCGGGKATQCTTLVTEDPLTEAAEGRGGAGVLPAPDHVMQASGRGREGHDLLVGVVSPQLELALRAEAGRGGGEGEGEEGMHDVGDVGDVGDMGTDGGEGEGEDGMRSGAGGMCPLLGCFAIAAGFREALGKAFGGLIIIIIKGQSLRSQRLRGYSQSKS